MRTSQWNWYCWNLGINISVSQYDNFTLFGTVTARIQFFNVSLSIQNSTIAGPSTTVEQDQIFGGVEA